MCLAPDIYFNDMDVISTYLKNDSQNGNLPRDDIHSHGIHVWYIYLHLP